MWFWESVTDYFLRWLKVERWVGNYHQSLCNEEKWDLINDSLEEKLWLSVSIPQTMHLVNCSTLLLGGNHPFIVIYPTLQLLDDLLSLQVANQSAKISSSFSCLNVVQTSSSRTPGQCKVHSTTRGTRNPFTPHLTFEVVRSGSE